MQSTNRRSNLRQHAIPILGERVVKLRLRDFLLDGARKALTAFSKALKFRQAFGNAFRLSRVMLGERFMIGDEVAKLGARLLMGAFAYGVREVSTRGFRLVGMCAGFVAVIGGGVQRVRVIRAALDSGLLRFGQLCFRAFQSGGGYGLRHVSFIVCCARSRAIIWLRREGFFIAPPLHSLLWIRTALNDRITG
ncbi:hypothetical protein AWB66_06188 [Caballeronia telluris]|uniref:Uncharacterized protein n=1 Tax=Caballeronia telluris TaxID=326475 RepID=A0A158KG82_9BURK|nr:hypothetical protein AWB66_06188 [Caballeronia telluris]